MDVHDILAPINVWLAEGFAIDERIKAKPPIEELPAVSLTQWSLRRSARSAQWRGGLGCSPAQPAGSTHYEAVRETSKD
jgi:hypothetical protein